MSRWLYYLLITAIIAPLIALIWGPQQEMAIFIASVISLIPLAALIGRTTEDLAYYVGPIAGGLLNATFGNAPELIIGIFALQSGLISVVKASITGSIISNILFVLGGSLALGGWRWGRQYFSARDAGQYSAMLVLAMAGLLIPAASTLIIKNETGRIQTISVAIAMILLLVYLLYLALHVFHVHSTRRTPRRKGKAPPPPPAESEEGTEEEEVNAVTGGMIAREVEEQKPPPYPWLSGLVLLAATIGTAWNSELLVGAIRPVTAQFGWSQTFIGLVIIPIAGNAAEHTSAVYIAYKDRVDLSMAIAAGSSIQVATLVAPLLVLISLFMGGTHLNLVFQPVELVVLGLAAILFPIITLDGESTWLAGVQLMAIYIMACVVFFLIPG
ncbi:MAG: calcium/proton exchanger [Ktedonobacteraceae bacterium]|nr:calcium/proton exchanger [Ktedonobacteraceae bacterium]